MEDLEMDSLNDSNKTFSSTASSFNQHDKTIICIQMIFLSELSFFTEGLPFVNSVSLIISH